MYFECRQDIYDCHCQTHNQHSLTLLYPNETNKTTEMVDESLESDGLFIVPFKYTLSFVCTS